MTSGLTQASTGPQKELWLLSSGFPFLTGHNTQNRIQGHLFLKEGLQEAANNFFSN
jgi:hypothetical protein